MMRRACGALAVAVTALLVCCSADPHQEQDVSPSHHASGERYDVNGPKTRNLDPLGGGNLVREVRETRHSGFVPYFMTRRYDYASPYSGKRELWPVPAEYSGYYGDGLPKRNFDEIDRSGLDTFVKKRNFDEIDRSSMPFPYAIKRSNSPNLKDTSLSNYDKKTNNQPAYPFFDIAHSPYFPIGPRRAQDFPLAQAL